MEPMVDHEYGCPAGYNADDAVSQSRPYGWFSYDWRRSFFTTSRWPGGFCAFEPARTPPRRRLPEQAVRLVLVRLAALVLHHVALAGELLRVERVQQPAHAVRLQPE